MKFASILHANLAATLARVVSQRKEARTVPTAPRVVSFNGGRLSLEQKKRIEQIQKKTIDRNAASR